MSENRAEGALGFGQGLEVQVQVLSGARPADFGRGLQAQVLAQAPPHPWPAGAGWGLE